LRPPYPADARKRPGRDGRRMWSVRGTSRAHGAPGARTRTSVICARVCRSRPWGTSLLFSYEGPRCGVFACVMSACGR
jgi:hypothetical protein